MKVNIICEFCNIEFKTDKYRLKAKHVFCSKKCYTKYQKSNKNEQRRRVELICKYCNKHFEIHRYQAYDKNKKKRRKYCSISCASLDNKRKVTQKQTHTCLHCKIKFKTWNHRKHVAKFCSTICHNEYRRNIIKCPSCKKQFIVPMFKVNRKYCSVECARIGIAKRSSKFQNFVKSILIKNKIKYEEEFYIKGDNFKLFADFKLNNNIIIECFGTYWHCDPRIYKPNYFHQKIRKNASQIWKEDSDRIDKLKSLNYNTIILHELDWRKDIKTFVKTLERIINEVCKN